MTLGGMVKHLTFVEQWWFTIVLHGRPPQGFWADVDWDADRGLGLEFRTARHARGAAGDATTTEVARSDAALDEALAAGDLDQPGKRARSDGHASATLRWILVHMVEEYARHAGHADLIRESVDGASTSEAPGQSVHVAQVTSSCRHRTLPSGSLNHAAFSSPNSQTWSTVFSSGRS